LPGQVQVVNPVAKPSKAVRLHCSALHGDHALMAHGHPGPRSQGCPGTVFGQFRAAADDQHIDVIAVNYRVVEAIVGWER